ncbi:hypothetical protein CGZ80_02625 [Rhodopirellula sp. MGV]|nr:hypothetical protein CGZ80_02625 [Rhodopirellula sp. MGV]PNY38483.1 hypothetical protein C2E31_00685 [Rhodopirellula baltica]
MLIALCLLSTGCLPSTRVIKNPGDRDKGVRYYRPKPFLKLAPMTNKAGEPVDGYVTIEQTVLPDYSEEYSIHVRSGLGSNETEITLTDGWRLDSLNVNIDSNFDENVKAIADLTKSLPIATSNAEKVPVKASNVPLGLYEAVVSKGCDGKKRLYGYRYVGFMPYSPCPVESCGLEQTSCNQGQIYGLIFEDERMVFRPLHDLMPGQTSVADRSAEEVHDEPAVIEDPIDDLPLNQF